MFFCQSCCCQTYHEVLGSGATVCQECAMETYPFDLSASAQVGSYDRCNMSGRVTYVREPYLMKELVKMGITEKEYVDIIRTDFCKIEISFDAMEKTRKNLLPLKFLISKIIERNHLPIDFHHIPKSKKTLNGYMKIYNVVEHLL